MREDEGMGQEKVKGRQTERQTQGDRARENCGGRGGVRDVAG